MSPNLPASESHPLETTMERFRRDEDFASLMLHAWGQVEFNVNQLVARELGMFHIDERFQKALKTPEFNRFNRRLKFLLSKGAISTAEFNELSSFARYRNRLVHGDEWAFFVMEQAEKIQRMDQAVDAARLTMEMLFR